MLREEMIQVSGTASGLQFRGGRLSARKDWIKAPHGFARTFRTRFRWSEESLPRLILRLQGRLRWWSFGAFGNKGRLEGSQYLAGRRAPPFMYQ